MRLESALYSSKSGLDAHGQAIAVVGDNISNANTVGFKASRIRFTDLFSAGADSTGEGTVGSSGNGVQVSKVEPVHETGVIEFTGRELDVAIAGEGFFVIGDTESQRYSRAGDFQINESGQLVNTDGTTVLGYAPNTETLAPLDMLNISTAGTPTSAITLFGNIDSGSDTTTVPTGVTSFRELDQAASFQTTVNAVDSLGELHDMTLAFFKTDIGSWTVQAYMDGGDLGGEAGTPTQVGADVTLAFGENGAIPDASQAAAQMTVAAAYSNGAAAGAFTVDLSGFTQYAGTSQLSSITQDGLPAGDVQSYEFDKTGEVYALLDNSTRVLIGTLPLARFPNVNGLERVGSKLFAPGSTAGDVSLGQAGIEGRGTIEASSLERSTVDTAEEFINLVLYQRGYQASSQTLNKANELIEQTLQLMR